ncbi:MAG: DUF84 family protein [Candidatus Saccharibacteria bacterium]|nr:DUF84 family protein [Candidatus Saccharibacteria bacterium]
MTQRVYMSTGSRLKHRAVMAAFARAGIAVEVDGVKVSSGVAEQPASIDETRQGALNRHQALRAMGVIADYYVTIESGLCELHSKHGLFGCQAVVIEHKGQKKVGLDIELEYPKSMTDKVPSIYADLGELVKAEYGALEKDPLPYITRGKITRQAMITEGVYKVITQMETSND